MKNLSDLRQAIDPDPKLDQLYRIVTERTRAAAADPGHELSHFMRVAMWTIRIGGREVDSREAIAAALLHDIINVPKNSPLRKEASRLCAEEAEKILSGLDFSRESIARVSEAIRCHSFSRGEKPVTALGKALQDADRLEALGSIGIMRCVSTGVVMGAKYFEPEDPWARNRKLDDSAYSIDHFFTKLLLLPDTMTTEAGHEEAQRRADTLRFFLERLGEELGDPAPDFSGRNIAPARI